MKYFQGKVAINLFFFVFIELRVTVVVPTSFFQPYKVLKPAVLCGKAKVVIINSLFFLCLGPLLMPLRKICEKPLFISQRCFHKSNYHSMMDESVVDIENPNTHSRFFVPENYSSNIKIMYIRNVTFNG